jgi:hypothetical protein
MNNKEFMRLNTSVKKILIKLIIYMDFSNYKVDSSFISI